MDLHEVVGELHLDLFPENWVKSVWAEDFTLTPELPAEYELLVEDADYVGLMNDFRLSIKNWLVNETVVEDGNVSISCEKKSWQYLLPAIDHKALLCFLSTFLRQDAKKLKDVDSISLALSAARLYFALLNINGAHVYKIFNTALYSQALESLKVGNLLCSGPSNKPQPSKGGRKKNNRKKSVQDPDTNEEQEAETSNLSHQEKRRLLDLLCSAIEDLQSCLKTFQLKNEYNSLVLTVRMLVALSRLAKNSYQFLSRLPEKGSITYLSYKAYELLTDLCHPNHGAVQETIRVIMVTLMPIFCCADQPVLHMSEKELGVVKEHSVQFVHRLANKFPSESFKPVIALLQQLCVRTIDKADIRAKFVQNILDLLKELPRKLVAFFVTWVVSLSFTEKVSDRITGIELLTKFLNLDEQSIDRGISFVYESDQNINPDESEERNDEICSSQSFLLGAVLSRCRDVSPRVRMKALSALVSATSKSVSCRLMVEKIFISNYYDVQVIEPKPDDKGFFNFQTHFLNNRRKSAEVDPLPSGTVIVEALEYLANDEKVFVRKNALLALANIFALNIKWATDEHLMLFVDSCKDSSVMVRKLMTQCLTDLLLEYPTHCSLPKFWVRGIIPLMDDNEKVIEAIENVILNNMVRHNTQGNILSMLPWKILTLISNLGLRKHFRYACKQWALKNRIKRQMFNIIESHIGTENNLPAWFLLFCLSEFQNVPNPKFVLNYYYDHIHNGNVTNEYWSQLVLEVVRLNLMGLNKESRKGLCEKLKEKIQKFCVPLPLIANSIEICHLLNPNDFKTWGESIIRACENYLNKTIAPGCPKKSLNETVLSQCVFTLGDVTQFVPGVLRKSTINILTKLVDSEYNDGGPERWEGTVGDCVCAVAITTLGKLALQDQFVAKSLVPSFGNLLVNQQKPSVKVNTIITLSDLYIKFTGLVESYLGEMFVCLRDSNQIVRTNTLTLLTQLIQEDYLKLRCPFFFYILFMLEDDMAVVREQTSAFMVNTVLSKNPSIMYQHFIEAVFFYNNFEEHSSFKKVLMSPQEKAAFCIPGDGNMERRIKIYRYMLNNMQDDQRFKITYMLCNDILLEVFKDKIPLDEIGTFVLRDTLRILACEEIRKVQQRGGKDTQDDDNGEVMEQVITEVRNSILTLLRKKDYKEYIMPIFIKLKNKLKELKSPILKDLMICLRVLLTDFKHEIKNILAEDLELAAEVEYDLRMMEEKKEESTADEEEENGKDDEYLARAEEMLITEYVNLGRPPTSLVLDISNLNIGASSTPSSSAPKSPVPTHFNQTPTTTTASSSSPPSSSSRKRRNRRKHSQRS